MPWLRLMILLLALLAPGAPGAAEAGGGAVRRVLVVYENEATLKAAIDVAEGLHQGLDAKSPTQFEIYSEYLDIVRFPGPERIARLAADLAAKYRDVRLDVAMAAGPGALTFMLDHRAAIAPGVPIVFGGLSESGLSKRGPLPADVTGVISRFDIGRTIDLARRLQPDAKRIVVITGSSAPDRIWAESAHTALDHAPGGLPATYLTDLSLAGFRTAAAALKPDTILLILTVFGDADGRRYVPREAAAEIAKAAGAPAYGVYSTYLGTGVVGGDVETFISVGMDMAGVASKLMEGGTPEAQIIHSTGKPLVDWRALKRWGIDVGRLPADGELMFYLPSPFERYRNEILVVVAVLILQAATIAALVVQNRRRRRVEAELALGRLELAHLSRTTQLGELSGAFAHELNQPLTAILANAEAGARLIRMDPVDLVELAEILADIAADDRRAANVIAQLRRLMIKGDADLEPLDLNDIVLATIALARSELVGRQTKLDFHREQPTLAVLGNLAQLQQVVLNLVLNATEAMLDSNPAHRRILIETRRRDDGAAELAVSDNGPGLSEELRQAAFEPFVSTKAAGLGLGLVICRSIATAHGGSLRFVGQVERGARIELVLPPAEALARGSP